MANVMKVPPKFEKESEYENWKRDISIWRELTDLEKGKQALAIHLSLSGRARIASSEIELAELKKDNGVETLLMKLDDLFLQDEGRRKFAVFHEMYNLRRSADTSVHEFICTFEHVSYNFASLKMNLPDAVMAFMLLASCNFAENEVQLVMSAISDVTYENMKAAIKRIFGGGAHGNYFSKAVKVLVSLQRPT